MNVCKLIRPVAAVLICLVAPAAASAGTPVVHSPPESADESGVETDPLTVICYSLD